MPSSPLSTPTWNALVELSRLALAERWGAPGVFAPAIGPRYEEGSPNSMLYIGKSGGPRIDGVGLGEDQAANSSATTRWMLERRNGSAFWRFADLLIPTRESMSWSNVAKIDRAGSRPPTSRQWKRMSGACLAALHEEIVGLRPRKLVFATGDFARKDLSRLILSLGYRETEAVAELKASFAGPRGIAAIIRHPQGWTREACARAVAQLHLRQAA